MSPTYLAGLLLRVDAVANLVLAAVTVVASSWLMTAMQLSSRASLGVLVVLFLANAALCWRAAAASRPSALRGLAAVDVVFGLAMMAIAVLNPTDAATGLRWSLGLVGDVSLTVGAAKLPLAARISPATSVRRVGG